MESTAYDDNPGGRPKKHASAADRQAAYRARGVTIEFRADPQTASTLDGIAATLDVSRAELLLSMTKFALTNHDWARFGLTHKTIPRYQGNPMATKASPAQIAARKRFAQMAKSGALAKKRKAASKPATRANPVSRAAPKPRATPRKLPTVVYQVQTKTPRGQWEVWTTVNYLEMAKEIAHRCAADPALRGRSIKVESFSVKS